MKLTKQFVSKFENWQKEYGTKVALYNVIWEIAADIFKEIGVKRIRTMDSMPNKPERNIRDTTSKSLKNYLSK